MSVQVGIGRDYRLGRMYTLAYTSHAKHSELSYLKGPRIYQSKAMTLVILMIRK